MAELISKDARPRAVIDKQSGRNLLDADDPTPLTVDTSAGRPVRFAVRIDNGPEGLLNLSLASDQFWLQPEQSRLTLVGGEKGECIITAKSDGDGEFANLLLSWEGESNTLCQSIMVMRKLAPKPKGAAAGAQTGAAGSAGGATSDKQATSTSVPKSDAVKSLEKLVDGCGGQDKFIDIKEEHAIFRKGGMLELTVNEVEGILNRKCSEGGWTRQTRLTEKLTAMLHEATKDDGVIDQGEFDHIVNFAVKRSMPRRDADEHCITLILDNAWKAKESMFNKWFSNKRKQYGL